MARVRRRLLLPDMLGACGAAEPALARSGEILWQSARNANTIDSCADKKLSPTWLTLSKAADYIRPHIGAPPLGAMVRLRSSSLIAVTGHRPQVGGSGFGGSPASGRGSCTPGCLTGESEERETWTAESLRVAWDGLRPCGLQSFGRQFPCHAAGRDFGGTRFRSTL